MILHSLLVGEDTYIELDEALGEHRPPWQIITPVLHNMKNMH